MLTGNPHADFVIVLALTLSLGYIVVMAVRELIGG